MSLRSIRLALATYVACALACGNTINLVYVPEPGAGDDAGADGPSTTTTVDAAEALDGGPYVPDLGRQSAAFMLNASHTSATDDRSLFGTTARLWNKDFPGLLAFPLIAHDKVVVTFSTADKRGAMQAFDALTGSSVWGPIDLGPSETWSSAYDGGRVFALSRRGTLRAFDVDTGAPWWTTELGNPATPIQFLGAPTAYNGQVYVLPNNFGQAFAVNEMTGAIAWQAAKWGGSASPAVTDDAVYLALGCHIAYRLDPATGAEVWHTTSNCVASAGTPVVYDQTLLLLSGTLLEKVDVTTGVLPTSATGSELSPAVHADTAFLTLVGDVRAVNLFGNGVTWQYQTDAFSFRTPPMVAGGHVYALWYDCTLRVFEEKTGTLMWSDSETCEPPWVNSGAPPVAMAAASGVIAVPYGTRLVIYGVAPAVDGGSDAASE